LVRQESPATADELASLQTQLNALPFVRFEQIQQTVGPAGTAAVLPAKPSGYLEIVIRGTSYVLPFYAKG
jgi:hypothetical protein